MFNFHYLPKLYYGLMMTIDCKGLYHACQEFINHNTAPLLMSPSCVLGIIVSLDLHINYLSENTSFLRLQQTCVNVSLLIRSGRVSDYLKEHCTQILYMDLHLMQNTVWIPDSFTFSLYWIIRSRDMIGAKYSLNYVESLDVVFASWQNVP